MRALAGFGVTAVLVAALCMPVALLGRAFDWSPYALTLLGAAAGFLAAFGLIMTLLALDPDELGPDHNVTHYRQGWRDGFDAAVEEAMAAGRAERGDR